MKGCLTSLSIGGCKLKLLNTNMHPPDLLSLKRFTTPSDGKDVE